jgi:hypothetical protein
MNSLLNISLQRGVVFLFIALCVVVGGTWTIVKIATEHLLYQDATSTARNWAQLLGESVNDLEQIAAGEQPSNASMMFFQWAQKAGQVFRYEIRPCDELPSVSSQVRGDFRLLTGCRRAR